MCETPNILSNKAIAIKTAFHPDSGHQEIIAGWISDQKIQGIFQITDT